MMFDSHNAGVHADAHSSYEPMARSAASGAKKSLRSRAGMLLVSTSLVAAATAMMTGEATAQVPAGFAPAPADVVSYVQLSNGSVLVQLANQQSLLVTSNNFFIDGTGVLFLSPAVTSGIAGGGAPSGAALAPEPLPAPLAPLPAATLPLAPVDPASLAGDGSASGVLFEDTETAASSGGLLGTITGGPGLFGLGTLGTLAAVGLGGGALLFAVNAIRSRIETPAEDNAAATVSAIDSSIERGATTGTVTYSISDVDGIDESELVLAVQAGLDGASTVASIFPSGAEISTERTGSGLIEGTEDTYASINVTLTGAIAEALNVGSFPGPAVNFTDAKGNEESVNFALEITDGDAGSGDGGSDSGTLELDQAEGSTHEIAQGGSKLFKATDPDGDTISYEISNNPTGIGIDSNTGLVVVASSVATGTYTITVKAMSTGADGTVETDTETYNITVTEGAGGTGSTGNTVNADFDTTSAGFNTLSGVNLTNGDTADSNDNEFEVVAAAHLANSYIMDGLAGDDTVYFSEAGATYHLDPTWVNGFEDVSGFETLELLSGVHLEINGGVLDSESTGDIEHLKGSGDNRVTVVNNNADFGLDVTLSNLDVIDMNNYDVTLDVSDLSQINTVEGDTQSTLVFTGQFTYDFAEGLIQTNDVTRLGFDAGNYDYSLTLDGVHDEDVREIYAYGANEVEGDIMIDARENSNIGLIDLAGDDFTTGGIDGDSNIFVTYDDALQVFGGDNDDDLDVVLDSDIEDGEFQFDGGGDNEDSLNVNLNGDEIDTRGFGRSIDHVEYVDIDAPDGDGEAHLQFDGHGADMSDIIRVDVSDVKDDATLILDGDRSALDASAENINDHDGVAMADGDVIDGFVADEDVIVHMTAQDDVIDMVIGESEVAAGGENSGIAILQSTALETASPTNARGSQSVDVHLGGGDDTVSLVLGSVQSDEVTLHFSRANHDDHDTVTFAELNDLSETTATDGLTLDFADDISTIIAADGLDGIGGVSSAAAGVNVSGSQQGALILFETASEHGFIYDHDGDGQLSDGDTLVDLTNAGANANAFTAISSTGFTLTLAAAEGGDVFNFTLDQGDLTI